MFLQGHFKVTALGNGNNKIRTRSNHAKLTLREQTNRSKEDQDLNRTN